MNRQKWIILAIALVLMAGAAGVLARYAHNHRLGEPGIRTSPIPGSQRLQLELPAQVLDYESRTQAVDQLTLDSLPQDTSFGCRVYTAPDGFQIILNIVLMGTDRTSLHKPQFCLESQGWHIDHNASAETQVRIDQARPYDLPVVKLISTKEVELEGRKAAYRGVYVYWFVADGAMSATKSGYQRMWWMARELLRTGVLQRWAYVSCFSVCPPGQEDAAFQRIKAFVAAAAPQFQLVGEVKPGPATTNVPSR
jgi:hypothetical protein